MKYSEFADQYRPLATVSSGLPPVQQELEGLAIEVGQQVHAYLLGESDLRTIGQYGVRYAQEARHCFGEVRGSIGSDTLKDRQDSAVYSNAATHLIHGLYLPYYFMLERAGKAKQNEKDINLGRAALSLAMEGTDIAIQRTELSEARFRTGGLPYKLFSKPYATYKRVAEGYGTEIDVLELLLEISRENPTVVVLPGLPQFERGRHGRATNADMLLFNTATQNAIGVQVKTRASNEDAKVYDGSVVQLVSGTEDLDNLRAVRTQPNSSSRKSIPWPGYMALHRLATIAPTSRVMRTYDPNFRKLLLQQRARAQAALGDTGPRFRIAKRRIGERLLPHLQDAPTASRPEHIIDAESLANGGQEGA